MSETLVSLTPRTPAGPPASPAPARFAVIIPAYDEVEGVPALFAALRSTFARHARLARHGEVVFVDDGSRDGTAAAARAAGVDLGVPLRVLSHPRNRGKTEALLTGAAATSAEQLVLFDADLQHSPEEIPRFLDKLAEGWDVVAGRKIGAYDKHSVSTVYNALSQRLFAVPARDLNAMKAFRRTVLDEVPLRHDWHRFLVVLAHACGHSVTEIDVVLHPRRAGVPKYDGHGRVPAALGDLLAVWFYLKFSAKPMQLFGGGGAVLVGLGTAIGTAATALRALHVPPPAIGYRPLLGLVVLLVMVGITLVGFGFVAEMIAILRTEIAELRRSARAADLRNAPAPVSGPPGPRRLHDDRTNVGDRPNRNGFPTRAR